MVAYLTRMPAGIPGQIIRVEHADVETQQYDATAPFSAYGMFGKINGNFKFAPLITGDAVAAIYGLLVRPYPTQSLTYPSQPLGTSTPPQTSNNVCNVLVRGYINVLLGSGTAVKNGGVYVRITAGGGKLPGSIEAASDGANTLLVPNCQFEGAADTNGNVSIRFNI